MCYDCERRDSPRREAVTSQLDLFDNHPSAEKRLNRWNGFRGKLLQKLRVKYIATFNQVTRDRNIQYHENNRIWRFKDGVGYRLDTINEIRRRKRLRKNEKLLQEIEKAGKHLVKCAGPNEFLFLKKICPILEKVRAPKYLFP